MRDLTPVPGFVGYLISPDGRVYSERSRRFLTCFVDPSFGYVRVGLLVAKKRQRMFYLHRLLATTFIPNPLGKPAVNHINGVKTDNRLENLEWVTDQENSQHAQATGLVKVPVGEDASAARLTAEQVLQIRSLHGVLSQDKIAAQYGVSRGCVQAILERKSWRHL